MAALSQQAEQDLVQFLKCRSRELVPGAKLLLATPGDTDQVRLCDGLYDVLHEACIDLVAESRLEPEQHERLYMPCYYRTVAELIAPLERDDSPVRGAFTIDNAEALEIPIPFIVEFQRGGDVAAYAEGFTGFLRAVSEPVVRAAFNSSNGEAETIDHLYERIRVRLLAEPERYLWHYTLVAAVLTRR